MANKNWTTRLIWGVLALVPIVVLLVVNGKEVVTWLETGYCPGGPMDRVSAPCGLSDFILIVLLGGWVAFIVIPILVAYWLCLLAAFALVRSLIARRRKHD